ncbi:hypothetical protein [Absidia glauca]|uniref:FAR1 domain-containing protein n=1 Tax=Absidia glauca TaxID=4829 RepID=A0A168RN16_ABSGL|nr:hypothetical protein [Absidia glauca]
MTQHEDLASQDNQSTHCQQSTLSGSRNAMEPLYERLLQQSFPDSHSAVEFCRHACAQFGFTVKQEASANKNIYVYCSREGLPDSQRKPKLAPQRKRPSKRCDCRWRVVLSENTNGHWEFRKSSNNTAYEHNHEMMDPNDMVKTWPAQVNLSIIQLARQRLQTHEIRDLVKQRFPDITWNERRFYNRLAEERKRIKQRDVVQRTRRLLFLSTQLCSLVAANEEWFDEVEAGLARFFDHYCYMNRLVPSKNDLSLVDLALDQITMDSDSHYHSIRLGLTTPADKHTAPSFTSTSTFSPHQSSVASDNSSISAGQMEFDDSQDAPTKKRKSMQSDQASSSTASLSPSPPPLSQASQSYQPQPQSQSQSQQPQKALSKGTHIVYVPPLTLFVRPQRSRSLSESVSASASASSSLQQSLIQQHRSSYPDSLSSPSTMMDVTSPHPHQTLSFNNTSFYSLASSHSSATSGFQQPQQRTSSSTAQQSKNKQSISSSSSITTIDSVTSSSTAATTTSSTPVNSNQIQQASSSSPQEPLYVPPTPFHARQNPSLSGGTSISLQHSTHSFPVQSFDSHYSSNTTVNSNSNGMDLFNRSSMEGGNMVASRQYNKMDHRQQQPELLDISSQQISQQQRYQQKRHHQHQQESQQGNDAAIGMAHCSTQPFFMYSAVSSPATSSTTTGHPISSYDHHFTHHSKHTLFDPQHQQHNVPPLFSAEAFQVSGSKQEGSSPTMDGVLLDNSSL